MSMPNIPNITPLISLDRCKTIDLILSSIALEEIGLSHILNAEGEKLQAIIKKNPACTQSYLDVNDSVNKTLRTIVKSQMLLQFKMEDAITLDGEHCKKKCHKKRCHKKDCTSCPEYEPDCEDTKHGCKEKPFYHDPFMEETD